MNLTEGSAPLTQFSATISHIYQYGVVGNWRCLVKVFTRAFSAPNVLLIVSDTHRIVAFEHTDVSMLAQANSAVHRMRKNGHIDHLAIDLILEKDIQLKSFSTFEIHLFELLNEHLKRAVKHFSLLQNYKYQMNVSCSVLKEKQEGYVVCDQYSNICFLNNEASKIINSYSVLNIIEHKLCFLPTNSNQIKPVHKNFLDFYNKNKSNDIDQAISIEITRIEYPYVSLRNDIQLYLINLNVNRGINWAQVTNNFELTAAELKLLKSVYAKHSIEYIAESFHVSYNTVRTHLQSIFKKAEVTSQVELIIKVNMFSR